MIVCKTATWQGYDVARIREATMVHFTKLRCPRFGWRMRDAGQVAAFVVLVLVLLLLIPPHGILSENEENYFALAEQFVGGSTWPRATAVFDVSPHRMLSDATLGALVWAVGYAPAQVVT